MATRLKGILVGLGGRGSHWYQAVRNHPETEYIAYVESAEANRARAIERWGLPPDKIFASLEEAVGQVDILFTMPWADSPGSHYVTQPFMFTKDMGIHHFDMLRYVLGRDPVSVRCVTWNPAWGWHAGDASHVAIFTFDEKLHAVHRGVGCAGGHHTGWNGEWRIEGPGGTLTWEGNEIWLTHLHRAEKRRREQIFTDRTGGDHDPPLTEFVTAIRENRDPECNAEDNLKSAAMVASAVKSAMEGGREVKLAEL